MFFSGWNNQLFKNMAESIVEIYPTEPLETYYTEGSEAGPISGRFKNQGTNIRKLGDRIVTRAQKRKAKSDVGMLKRPKITSMIFSNN